MNLPEAQTQFTVEEYLALERESEERHAYLDTDHDPGIVVEVFWQRQSYFLRKG
jgi:hypothetical protein